MLTLFVVANKDHFPERCLILCQYRQVIPNFNLTRLVDDDGLDRDDFRESVCHELVCRQHADGTKHNPGSQHQTFVFVYCALEISGFNYVVPDDLIQMLVPLMSSLNESEAAYSKQKTYHSKWKSFETRSLKSKNSQSTNFSATFLTATFDCAMTQTVLEGCSAILLCTAAAITVVFPVPGGP